MQIPGVNARTKAAIRTAECRLVWPGDVGRALVVYRQFLGQRGRWLYLPWSECECCDPATARDTLELALRLLSAGPRAELRRIVTPLDDEFRRRTIPDASAVSSWQATAWWRWRPRGR